MSDPSPTTRPADDGAGPATDSPDDGAPEPTGTGSDDARGPLARAAPWILVVLALGVAVFSTWQWQQLDAQADTRSEVRLAARDFMITLTTWDAAGGLDETREQLRAAGTGPFLDEVDEFFGTLSGRLGGDVISEGEVENVYVQELEGDHAEVFAVVRQTIRSEAVEDRAVRRSVVDLQRADGEWLVADVRLISDEVPATDAPQPTPQSQGQEQP